MDYFKDFIADVAGELGIDAVAFERAIMEVALRRTMPRRMSAVMPGAALQNAISESVAQIKANIGQGFEIPQTGMTRRFEMERITDSPAAQTDKAHMPRPMGREAA